MDYLVKNIQEINDETKHIALFSGGEASALVAVELVRRYGKENVILLNHDINPRYESADIKRFKQEVSDYLQIPITYCNINDCLNPLDIPSQFQVCLEAGAFVNPKTRDALCTNRLKTAPFERFLSSLESIDNIIVYYGFDSAEFKRVDRRKAILNDKGVQSDYPLALWGSHNWNNFLEYYKKESISLKVVDLEFFLNNSAYERTIFNISEIGIKRPLDYDVWKHANCVGCLKAGKQHWYCVYVHRRDVYQEAMSAEDQLGYTIGKESLKDLSIEFEAMRLAGVPASEHIASSLFWKSARRYTSPGRVDLFPCECFSINI